MTNLIHTCFILQYVYYNKRIEKYGKCLSRWSLSKIILIMVFIIVTDYNLHDDDFLEKTIFCDTIDCLWQIITQRRACEQIYFHVLCFHEIGSEKLKVTPVQALRLRTGRTAHRGSRGIALPFHDHGTRRGWGVSVTPWPLFTSGKDPVPIVQEAGWHYLESNQWPSDL